MLYFDVCCHVCSFLKTVVHSLFSGCRYAEKSKILNEKRSDNTKLAKHKESVLSELEKLRRLNRAHRKLMVEIWQHLTALAKVG